MTHETESSQESERPAELRLITEAGKRLKFLALDADRQVRERIDRPADISELVFLDETRVDLPLESIGCDAVEFKYIEQTKFDGGKLANADAPGALAITLKLFSDGSPFVVDGDILEDDPDDNQYYLVLAAELPPTLVQKWQADELDQKEWATANKHVLSAEDCELFLEKLPSLRVNVEAEVEFNN